MQHRFDFIFMSLFLLALLFAVPVVAGTIAAGSDGKASWRSTQCAAPPAPAALAHDPETRANDVNSRVNAYNDYVRAEQAYMNCVSAEAQSDASTNNQVIVNEAQQRIIAEQQRMQIIRASLQLPSAR